MYGALWRILPGPVWVRVLILLVLAVGVLYALAAWVFPWVEAMTVRENVTIDPSS